MIREEVERIAREAVTAYEADLVRQTKGKKVKATLSGHIESAIWTALRSDTVGFKEASNATEPAICTSCMMKNIKKRGGDTVSQYGEPWEAKWVEDDMVIYTEDDLVVAFIDPTACDGVELDTEHEHMPCIDRAVLCVNTCAGLTDSEVVAMRELWERSKK